MDNIQIELKICSAITTKGIPCKNKPLTNNQVTTQYCKRHSKLFKFEKPDDCPVCSENLSLEYQPLSCGHWVHKKCVIKWGKPQCPVCRTEIKLTKKERHLIDRNNKKENNPDIQLLNFDLTEGFLLLDSENNAYIIPLDILVNY